jgi:hypothetical protein
VILAPNVLLSVLANARSSSSPYSKISLSSPVIIMSPVPDPVEGFARPITASYAAPSAAFSVNVTSSDVDGLLLNFNVSFTNRNRLDSVVLSASAPLVAVAG